MQSRNLKYGFIIHPEEWRMIRDTINEHDIVAALFPVLDACLLSEDPSESIGNIIKTNLVSRILWDRNARDIKTLDDKKDKARYRMRERRESNNDSFVATELKVASSTLSTSEKSEKSDDRPSFVPTDKEALELGRLSKIPDEYTKKFMDLMSDKGWGYVSPNGHYVQLSRKVFRSVLKSFYDRDQISKKESKKNQINSTTLKSGNYKIRLGRDDNAETTVEEPK